MSEPLLKSMSFDCDHYYFFLLLPAAFWLIKDSLLLVCFNTEEPQWGLSYKDFKEEGKNAYKNSNGIIAWEAPCLGWFSDFIQVNITFKILSDFNLNEEEEDDKVPHLASDPVFCFLLSINSKP